VFIEKLPFTTLGMSSTSSLLITETLPPGAEEVGWVGPMKWAGWAYLTLLRSSTLAAWVYGLTTPRWHVLLVPGSSRSLLICIWGKQAFFHLILGTHTA